MTKESSSIEAQGQAARQIAAYVVEALSTDRGAHAETVVAGAARMGGTLLFRSFNLPAANIPPGSPVFSDLANQRGPVLIEVLTAGLAGLGIDVTGHPLAEVPPNHAPHLTVIETQQKLNRNVADIATSHGLAGEDAARSCMLAAALLIQQTRGVLDPALGFAIATQGVMEGSKTMPMPFSTPLTSQIERKPWYKF